MRASMATCEPLPSTIVVLSLVAVTRRAWPSLLMFTFSSRSPTSSEMTWPPVSTAVSSSMALRRSPKPGGLDGQRLQCASQLVDDQRGQYLSIHVPCDDDQRPADLRKLLQ